MLHNFTMATWYILFLCVIGVGASICPMTTVTCCPQSVEESMEAATSRTLAGFAPEYTIYLNVSEKLFFSHYGKCVHVRACWQYCIQQVRGGQSYISMFHVL